MKPGRWICSLAIVCVSLWAATAQAHPRSTSYSNWTIDGRHATVRVSISAFDANALQSWLSSTGDDILRYLQASLVLNSDGGICQTRNGVQLDWAERARFEWQLDCPTDVGLFIENDALYHLIAAHIHFASVAMVGSNTASDYVLTEENRQTPTDGAFQRLSPGETVSTYFLMGAKHISSGWDHLAFLLVLLLGLERLRLVILAVTGFTLGHSLTLILATLGLATPHSTTVQALIGLSIVLVSIENTWTTHRSRSFWLPVTAIGILGATCGLVHLFGSISTLALVGVTVFAACYFTLVHRTDESVPLKTAVVILFGLLHGSGFAGALGPLRIDSDELVVALASFNVGVEAGQLLIVVISLPILRFLARRAPIGSRLMGSWIGAALGTFWFVSRSFV